MILPFLEQQQLYELFDLKLPITNLANRRARGTVLSAVLCPSDPYNSELFNGLLNDSVKHYSDEMGEGMKFSDGLERSDE